MDDKRYAVLIDSDNISSKYISDILDEMTKYGVITYKRIYGDWTSTQASKWKKELMEKLYNILYSSFVIQQARMQQTQRL